MASQWKLIENSTQALIKMGKMTVSKLSAGDYVLDFFFSFLN